ncbi:MAG: FAD-dependent oxidoreductase [Bacilli bacterium]|jgi:hypothetical protein|nr:FAD-dependent oxidoreductase [Bacilli bacterium]MCH4210790.1 FAD-dependent oxidoreductase [Bacilli bacterium]MCH4228585.1 FAD-dependent oxidoreductase [Bacilli bacterium]MCH4277887.1 FAD-dependent oxidoreductase [Bacilli bacterium]MCI2055314.1 FAD-dependent oxidoreductase [Bacilli bacterium]
MTNLDERICIIGGGPAGVTAAMYLEKKGYKNYSIYEKADYVGGKCYSPTLVMGKDPNDKRTIEMGAIMGAKTYWAVHEAEEFAGIDHADGPKMSRIYRNKEGKEIFPFEPMKNFSFKKLFYLIKLKKSVKKIADLMETKYKGYDVNGHRGVAEGKFDGLSKEVPNHMEHVEGTNPNLKDLCLPFTEFCKKNHVEPVMDIWVYPFTSFGYGYFDEMPAAYVLKYLDITTTLEFVNTRLWTWKNGTMSIFQGVDKKLLHPAILNTEVTNVERPEGGKIKVTIKDAKGSHVEEFDKLIVTTPLDYFAKFADADAEEKELFSKIVHEKYVSMATRQEFGKGPEISSYIKENMTPETRGHLMVFYHRWNDIPDQPIITYSLRNHKGDEDVSYEYTRKTTLDDMSKCGFPVKKVEIEQEWYYCPHINTEDYTAGWYDKLDKKQGNRNTYYAGEIICFGDMEETCEASKDLIGRFF